MRRFVLFPLLVSFLYSAVPFKPSFVCKAAELDWAGMICSEKDPCPVYLEVSSVYSTGGRLFVTGNIHSAESTLYSILLASGDNGATWQEPVERMRGAELDATQFVPGGVGFISGQRVFPISGDPFFLITSDGGQSWHKSPMLPEGSDGAIQRFWFDSAKTGSLALDRGGSDGEQMRYARYETMTGGDSWSVRETSEKPIAVGPKELPPDQAQWRARGEPKRKVLVIEKKTDGVWKPVTELALELARCTGEEP